MDSPAAPQTPTAQKKTFFVDTPLKPQQQEECVQAWSNIKTLLLEAPTKAEQQSILDETTLFLAKTAEAQGLTFDVEAMTEALEASEAEEEGEEEEESLSEEAENLADGHATFQRASGQDQLQAVEKALDGISVDIGGSLNRDMLKEMRAKFVEALMAQPVRMMRNNQEKQVWLDAPDVSKITNFFFSEVWGAKGVNRVRRICKEYLISGEEGFDGGLRQRAEAVVKDMSIPTVCRNLVQGLSKTVQTDAPDSSDMRGFRNNCNFYNFFQHYSELLRQAPRPGRALQREWQRRKVETGKGHTYANQVQQYLINVLQLTDASQLGNTITQSTLINQFVKMYGPGILLLLPRGAPRFLQRTGVSKVTRGADLWVQVSKDHHDEIMEVCNFLEAYIYLPMVNGETLWVDTINGGSSVPFLTRLAQAKSSKEASGNTDVDAEMSDETSDEMEDEE